MKTIEVSGNRVEHGLGTRYENGANGIWTHDLLHAMQALSQLSYGPEVPQ